MSKNKMIVSGSVILGAIILFVVAAHANLIIFPIVRSSEARLLDGLDDDRVLVGVSHNVFVGKVVRKIGQTTGEAGPLTQYDVQVISNIKGTLSGSVVINQEGGYVNGILQLTENQPLMTVGTTYVLTTRTNSQGEYLASSYPRGWRVVSTDARLTIQQLQAIAASDKTVAAFQDAYVHEIPFQYDVDHNNALNSYSSLRATR